MGCGYLFAISGYDSRCLVVTVSFVFVVINLAEHLFPTIALVVKGVSRVGLRTYILLRLLRLNA